MKFMKLLRGCFKNTVFISPHEAVRKLPTMPLVTQHTTSVLSGDNPLIIKGNQGNPHKSIVLQKLESIYKPNAPKTHLKAPVSTVVMRHFFTNNPLQLFQINLLHVYRYQTTSDTGQMHAGHNYDTDTSCRPDNCVGPARQPVDPFN